jgi:hypothetical protein
VLTAYFCNFSKPCKVNAFKHRNNLAANTLNYMSYYVLIQSNKVIFLSLVSSPICVVSACEIQKVTYANMYLFRSTNIEYEQTSAIVFINFPKQNIVNVKAGRYMLSGLET